MKQKSNWQLFLLSYFAYASIYIARLNLTIASPVMQEQTILTSAQIGIMGGLFFLFYAAGQLVNGYLGDMLPPKHMVLAGLLLTAVSNFMIGFLPPAGIILVLWGVNGFAQSMLWGPLLRALSSQFSGGSRAEIASRLVSSVGVGSLLGILIATAAIYWGDVRLAFMIPGLISAVAAGTVFWLYRSALSGSAGKAERNYRALRSRSLWILLVPALFHGVLKDNLNLWAASYFADVFALDLVKMSLYVFAIPALSLAGRLIYPFLLRLCSGREHTVSRAALALIVICLLPLCSGHASMLIAAVCLSVIAAAVSVVNTSFLTVYPIRYADSGCVSSVVGMMDFFTYLGAGLSSILYGRLLEAHDYTALFVSWLVLVILALSIIQIHEYMEKEKKHE